MYSKINFSMKKIFYLFLIMFFVCGISVGQVSAKTVKAKKAPIKTQVVKKKVPAKKTKTKTAGAKKVVGKKVKTASVKDSSDYVPPTRFDAAAAAAKPAYAGAKQPPAGYMQAINTALNDYLQAKKAAHGDKTKLKDAEDAYNAAMQDAGTMLQ